MISDNLLRSLHEMLVVPHDLVMIVHVRPPPIRLQNDVDRSYHSTYHYMLMYLGPSIVCTTEQLVAGLV